MDGAVFVFVVVVAAVFVIVVTSAVSIVQSNLVRLCRKTQKLRRQCPKAAERSFFAIPKIAKEDRNLGRDGGEMGRDGGEMVARWWKDGGA